jgi:hypothetical protein
VQLSQQPETLVILGAMDLKPCKIAQNDGDLPMNNGDFVMKK